MRPVCSCFEILTSVECATADADATVCKFEEGVVAQHPRFRQAGVVTKQ